LIKDELHLAHVLQEQLTPAFNKVYTNINLASNRFYPHWREWFGEPLPSAQPQIDILLVDKALWLLSAEIKFFRKTKRNQTSHPFYTGIDEALALLRFGFQVVSLWHFFDEALGAEEAMKNYRSCSSLIGTLDLPLNYEAYWMTDADTYVSFYQFSQFGISDERCLPNAYGKSNPLKSNIDAQRIQDILRAVLRIPHQR